MKKIFMFILAAVSVLYLIALCAVQLGWAGSDANFNMIATYGGVVIAAAIAGFTFFGKGVKMLFLILLLIVLIVFVILQANPDLLSFLKI